MKTVSNKSAASGYPMHDLIAGRWSPRAFADEPVTTEQLGSLLEAARWAPSCYNDQPWRFVVVRREDPSAFGALADCLAEGNAWAKRAPALVLTVAKLNFEHSGAPNRHAAHDVGLATENLVLQAEALGMVTHQMAGFDAARAAAATGLPEGFEPVAVIAIGKRGDPDALPEALREREQAPRVRKPLSELVFEGDFGARPAWLVEEAAP